MRSLPLTVPYMTIITLAVAVCGAALGWVVSMPAAFLVGPALAVSLAGLVGLQMGIGHGLRDSFMLVIGLAIGAGFDADAGAAILRWPLAFGVLAATLLVTLIIGRMVLTRWFGFDGQSAILAVVPGHLSMAIGIATASDLDVGRVILVQTIRLLLLIVLVPFAALALGYEMQASVLPAGTPMSWGHLAILTLAGLVLAFGFRRFDLPAPMLLGPMIASGIGHMSGLTPGTVPGWILSIAFIGMGALIGSRFSGMSPALVRSGLLAGLVSTGLAVVLSVAAALPVAMALNMPGVHVMTAFSPGGFETMIALGVAMGASPGFVAACHVMRLVVLSALLPLFLRSTPGKARSSSR